MSGVPVERIDGVRVARPEGDIDAANASQVERELVESLAPDGDCLVLDLRDTRYLDSAALDMVFRLNERLHQRRGGLQVVISGDSPLSRLAAIVGLPKVIPVHESVEDALARCSQDREARRESEPPPLAGGAGEPDGARHHCGR
ncbi:MAG TPA: STAS domain-containing protein [Solirubrobacteraceae bacterium]|nr:STAS domain-containing protein [Solirubrobacteraceae bacterium]